MKPWQLYRCIDVVSAGGVIAYPTEAVYGLGCSPFDVTAVLRILALKRRKSSKGLILVGADISQFYQLLNLDAVPDLTQVLSTWPGPVTWIIPAKRGVPDWLTGGNPGLAVRISAHPLVQDICRNLGPLVSTSANPAATPPARTFQQVRNYFNTGIDYILPGQVGSATKPSEIRDAITGKILRRGG